MHFTNSMPLPQRKHKKKVTEERYLPVKIIKPFKLLYHSQALLVCVYQIKSVGLWIFLVVCNHINLPCVLQSIKTHFTGCLSPPLSPLYKKLTALPHVLPSSIVTLISAVVFISSCTSPHLTHSSPTADLSYNGFIFSSVTCYTH